MSGLTTTRRLTLVWVGLLVLTFGSFIVGIEQGADFASAATAILIGIAMFKVRLIGIHFMDVRVAPRGLRILFEAYVIVVFVVLALIDVVVIK